MKCKKHNFADCQKLFKLLFWLCTNYHSVLLAAGLPFDVYFLAPPVLSPLCVPQNTGVPGDEPNPNLEQDVDALVPSAEVLVSGERQANNQ